MPGNNIKRCPRWIGIVVYQLGLGSVGPVLSGNIGLLIHRLWQSSHTGHVEVS